MRKRIKRNKKGWSWRLKLRLLLFLLIILIAFMLLRQGFIVLSHNIPHLSLPGMPEFAQGSSRIMGTVNGSKYKLSSLLTSNNIPVANIEELPDGQFHLALASGEEVLLTSQKSLESQVSSLQLITSRLRIEGRKFIKLDLRFDKPVITFQ